VPYRPAWAGIFAKAIALTAREFPELRRVYVKWPWAHLYEYPEVTVSIMVNREHDGEPCVLPLVIRDPATRPISVIAQVIEKHVTAPIAEIRAFRRVLALGKLPGIVRRPLFWLGYNLPRSRATYFGTCAITSVSFTGSELLYVPTPTTSLLTFGVFGPDGRTPVRMVIDHRVMDGMQFAAILARLEAIMNGPILDELREEAAPAGRRSIHAVSGHRV